METSDKRDRKIKIIENDIVDRLKRDPKPCKYFSKQYMLNVKMLPLNRVNTSSQLSITIFLYFGEGQGQIMQ